MLKKPFVLYQHLVLQHELCSVYQCLLVETAIFLLITISNISPTLFNGAAALWL